MKAETREQWLRRQQVEPLPLPDAPPHPTTDLDELLARLELARPAWVAQAACRGMDPEHFFPDRGESTTIAKTMCAGCPVQEQCLDAALDQGEKFGVWGGTSERERRTIRRGRGRRSNAAVCGTRSKYAAGCRCGACRLAAAEYARTYRAAGGVA